MSGWIRVFFFPFIPLRNLFPPSPRRRRRVSFIFLPIETTGGQFLLFFSVSCLVNFFGPESRTETMSPALVGWEQSDGETISLIVRMISDVIWDALLSNDNLRADRQQKKASAAIYLRAVRSIHLDSPLAPLSAWYKFDFIANFNILPILCFDVVVCLRTRRETTTERE